MHLTLSSLSRGDQRSPVRKISLFQDIGVLLPADPSHRAAGLLAAARNDVPLPFPPRVCGMLPITEYSPEPYQIASLPGVHAQNYYLPKLNGTWSFS